MLTAAIDHVAPRFALSALLYVATMAVCKIVLACPTLIR